MTNEEAIKIIKSECYITDLLNLDRTQMVNTALDMVIKALEQQNKSETPTGSDPCDGCRYELNSTNGNPCYSCGKYKLTEQQPCEDCISRKSLLKHLENITMDTNPDHYDSKDKWYQANGFNLCKVGIEMYVAELPSVTPTYDLEEYSTKLWKIAYERGKAESEE